MSSAGALTAVGSDLAFSVSFAIAQELLNAATEAHLSEEELISVVLALSIILSAIPPSIKGVRLELERRASRDAKRQDESLKKSETSHSGLLEFLLLLVGMAQRISVSVCVQLLASNVRTRQPLRSVRIVTLLAVAIFFLFLDSTSSVGQNVSR
jgi:hypothetical protein